MCEKYVSVKLVLVIYNLKTKEIFVIEDVAADIWRIISTNLKVSTSEDFESDIIRIMQNWNQLYSATFDLTYKCNFTIFLEMYWNARILSN